MNNVTIAPTSTYSVFKALDARIASRLKSTIKPTTNTKLLYKAGSSLIVTNLGKLSY